jgi:predicted RNase H-like nuclease
MLIIGIDLAWGNKKPDGVCFIDATRASARVTGYAYPKGDDALLELLSSATERRRSSFITIDAPIVCPNVTGTRPVDRLTHTLFHREHAACHPANLTKCPRPVRIRERLEALGFTTGWHPGRGRKVVSEVYPHPAMVRLFGLPRIIKYKKGSVGPRRKEFVRLQRLIRVTARTRFPFLEFDTASRRLLRTPWKKPVEDLTDALFCAMIGLWHWHYRGKRSQIIGARKTGFILLPADEGPGGA